MPEGACLSFASTLSARGIVDPGWYIMTNSIGGWRAADTCRSVAATGNVRQRLLTALGMAQNWAS